MINARAYRAGVSSFRLVGKTTLLRKIAEANRAYVTLDNPLIRDLARTDPELFLQRYQSPVFMPQNIHDTNYSVRSYFTGKGQG